MWMEKLLVTGNCFWWSLLFKTTLDPIDFHIVLCKEYFVVLRLFVCAFICNFNRAMKLRI